jgi:hypothetical protein
LGGSATPGMPITVRSAGRSSLGAGAAAAAGALGGSATPGMPITVRSAGRSSPDAGAACGAPHALPATSGISREVRTVGRFPRSSGMGARCAGAAPGRPNIVCGAGRPAASGDVPALGVAGAPTLTTAATLTGGAASNSTRVRARTSDSCAFWSIALTATRRVWAESSDSAGASGAAEGGGSNSVFAASRGALGAPAPSTVPQRLQNFALSAASFPHIGQVAMGESLRKPGRRENPKPPKLFRSPGDGTKWTRKVAS